MNRRNRSCTIFSPAVLLFVLLAALFVHSPSVAQMQIYSTTTLAGSGVQDYADGAGIAARFDNPSGITNDGAGNLYITENYRIRKIVIATGVVTTLAGGNQGYADGVRGEARFFSPSSIASDDAGNLYVTDNHRIRKVAITTGAVTTLAGSDSAGNADGVGTAAQFFQPNGITSDGAGNLYIADTENHRIRKVVIATGEVTTIAGGAFGYGDGVGTSARFLSPNGITADDAGNLYVADTGNRRIRKVMIATGQVTTLAEIPLYLIRGITTDGVGNLYITQDVFFLYSSVSKISIATGAVTMIAGDKWGYADGTSATVRFKTPTGITADDAGNLYVADTYNHRIRRITDITPASAPTSFSGLPPFLSITRNTQYSFRFTANGTPAPQYTLARGTLPPGLLLNPKTGELSGIPSTVGTFSFAIAATNTSGTLVSTTVTVQVSRVQIGTVTTLAGSNAGNADGVGATARLNFPYGITSDGAGNLYVADVNNNCIRKVVIATGEVTTLVGSAVWSIFNKPYGVTSDGAGNLYVADTDNNRICKVVIATGVVTTLAGGVVGNTDGVGMAARFNKPLGITSDGRGNLFVTDYFNYRVRKVVIETGEVTTLAGDSSGYADGVGRAARFRTSVGITSDGAGNLYVADTYNHCIRKIVIATGTVTTLAGASFTAGYFDGVGSAAQFNVLAGITSDGAGNLYLVDAANNRIRKIVISTGEVTTLAGNAPSGDTDGVGTAARFASPLGITHDGMGNLYVSDTGNHRIRKITFVER